MVAQKSHQVVILFFLGFGMFLVVSWATYLASSAADKKYINQSHIKSLAVMHDDSLYTLNDIDSTKLINLLNHSVKVIGVKPSKHKAPNISKIIIYQTENEPAIEITPVAYVDHNLVYYSPSIANESYLMEVSKGKVQKMLAKIFKK